MSTPHPGVQSRPGWPVVLLAVLSGVAMLPIGFMYLVSGLTVPMYALLPLWIWWFAQMWFLVRLAARGSWWTPVVPVAAAASWVLLLVLGEYVLGWQA